MLFRSLVRESADEVVVDRGGDEVDDALLGSASAGDEWGERRARFECDLRKTVREGKRRAKGRDGTHSEVSARLGHDFEFLEVLVLREEPSQVLLRRRKACCRQ